MLIEIFKDQDFCKFTGGQDKGGMDSVEYNIAVKHFILFYPLYSPLIKLAKIWPSIKFDVKLYFIVI